MEIGIRRKLLGQFGSIKEAEEFFRERFSWSSRIDFDPPIYSTSRRIVDKLEQAISFSEKVVIVKSKESEYVLEYRPNSHGASISHRSPLPLLIVRPEIASLIKIKLDVKKLEELRFHFLGEAEAILVAECMAKWSHEEDIFAELLKLFFRAPRWPVIALNLLPEEILLKKVEAEGCPLNFCAFSAWRGELEQVPPQYHCPEDFPDELMPINQPIPNIKLGEKLGWTYVGMTQQYLREGHIFLCIWIDVWNHTENPDRFVSLPVNFWPVEADHA
ncbi:hypothetical protein ACFP81_08680 [Deinococcus lacus]|uniref:Uncharacterized protein n=1 Tax=Deinococcus lacus TaxID=392561 RepID=A0ABW1YFM3_9DEIO